MTTATTTPRKTGRAADTWPTWTDARWTLADRFGLICTDRRRPEHGTPFRALTFATAAEAHAWVDRADDATRAALVAGGYRVRRLAE